MSIPETLKTEWKCRIQQSDHPRELVVDVLLAIQGQIGYVDDQALREAADWLQVDPLEIEEIATFYTFIYREPVGRYVIHLCDSVICWLGGYDALRNHLCRKLGIALGGTTADGLFTLLPVCCIGYCDRSPAMLINGKVYGPLTEETLDRILSELRVAASDKEL